jgi:hypothetical protein
MNRGNVMDEHDLHTLVRALLEELKDPQRHLSTISNDFRECGIDYCVIGSLAVRVHNYVREGDDIDVIVSRETLPRVEKYLIGHGYSYRPGSNRHLYYEYPGGRTAIDVYLEGEERDGIVLPNPRGSRIKVCGIWYGSLPLIVSLKIRSNDLGDVIELIQANNLNAEFASTLEPDTKGKFLEILRKREGSCP